MIGGSAKFGVLDPQISLHLLQGTQEGQNGDVPFRNWPTVALAVERGQTRQQPGAHSGRARRKHSVLQKFTPIRFTTEHTTSVLHFFLLFLAEFRACYILQN